MKKIEEYVKSIPDFPEKGIIFRDVTSVLQDADGLHLAIDEMQKFLEGVEFDVIAGTESRGFIFGVPIAYNLHKAFVPVRKKGKLPRETVSAEYELEYGKAEIEMHKDAIQPGQKVVLVDDLIATGGTIEAAARLVEELGGEVVKIIFLMELEGLKGREKLKGYDVSASADISGYTDASSVSSWATDAMRWAVSAGLINGRTATTLAPQGNATRAEVASILMRFMQKYTK